jgi:protease-4
MITALEEATQDATIKAIVLRINSLGGSPHASDLIWHAVVRAQAVKPVIVSMSSVAASGGYYIAAGAGKVVAQPASITGSIGVVILHVNVQKLLSQFGVHTETLTRGRYTELFDTSKSWSPEERREVQRITQNVYQTFVRKVAQGRGMSVEAVDGVAGGRVWTGARAKEAGLVDALGGLETAMQMAKEEAGMPADSHPQLVVFPKAPGLLTALFKRISGHVWSGVELSPPLREGVALLAPFLQQQPGPLVTLPLHLSIR